ncbi:MAG: hypothetical protein H6575_07920 [Lewinellaceae bacterium]|nr:hypothetical protein [Saprospiraceae bacterium]MCB0543557.1 hypothetical protein [Saprospiraceae bacterium]MCB9354480.1 hypothetical protein [Lewinellaceae bacterium]
MAALSERAFQTLQTQQFSNATHLNGFFLGNTGFDFIDWFNLHLAGKGAFAKRRIAPDTGEDLNTVKREFVEFWDSIPLIFDEDSISVIDFASLMCIAINETGGRFRSVTEICGRGAKDRNGVRHSGLAYAFDRIPGIKKSYNTIAGNVSAFDCFASPVFCAAHASLGLAGTLAGSDDPTAIDPVWKGETYPSDRFQTVEDLVETGFVMQADFYKFRGRGPIQITGRAPYRKIVQYILSYEGTNPVLNKYKNRWQSLSADDACYASSDLDWDEIFAQKRIVALSLRIYADLASPSRNMLVISKDLDSLNDDKRRAGSIWNIGRTISGSSRYANDDYKPRVVEMLETIAQHTGARV